MGGWRCDRRRRGGAGAARFRASGARQLSIGGDITDAGLKALSRPDCGLKSLTELDLRGTQVGDAGAKELARPDCGVALVTLNLSHTKVTDEALAQLGRPNSRLKGLARLDLSGTLAGGHNLENIGLAGLSRSDSGLKSLAWLDLSETAVVNSELGELSRPDTGLRSLIDLNLSGDYINDEGLQAFARPDSGLRSLRSIDVTGTKVTQAGADLLRKARPELNVKWGGR